MATAQVDESTAPAPWVPLSFLSVSGIGLIGAGLGAWFAADRLANTPTHPGAVSAVHVSVLAFATMGVLGALHQLTPVLGQRPLRSTRAAGVTFAGMLVTAWMLPSGFAHGPEWLIPTAGLIGFATVCLAAWNLSAALSTRNSELALTGLRTSVGFLVLTVAFGAVYALDRSYFWFPLLSNRVLAHAHLGLLGWLGLTYVSVAEKLWPMFMGSSRPTSHTGRIAVFSLGAGTLVLALGLLLALPVLGWVGGVAAAVGIGAHLLSLTEFVRHRGTALEMFHAYVFTSCAFVIAAIALATVAAWPGMVTTEVRFQLVSAEVAALIAWIALALLGHAHRIVPVISFTGLLERGVLTDDHGEPLLPTQLMSMPAGWSALGLAGVGFAAVVVSLATNMEGVLALGAATVALAGVVVVANLSKGPRWLVRAARNNAPDAVLGEETAHDLSAR